MPKALPPLFEAVRNAHLEAVKKCIQDGVDIGFQDQKGYTVLHVAAENGQLEILQELVKEIERQEKKFGTPSATLFYRYWSLRNNNGDTPLHLLAERGNVTIIEWFFSFPEFHHVRSMYLMSKDKDGRTPLHRAARWGKLETVKALLNTAGKVVSIEGWVDTQNNTLRLNALNRTSKARYTVLHCAIESGSVELVQFLLSLPELQSSLHDYINQPNLFGWTPIHMAIYSSVSVMQALLNVTREEKRLVDIDASLPDGNTVFHTAGNDVINIDVLKILLQLPEVQSNLRFYLNQSNNKQQTVLHLRAKTLSQLDQDIRAPEKQRYKKANQEMYDGIKNGMQYLLTLKDDNDQFVMDIETRDKDGKTFLSYCHDVEGIETLLRESRAQPKIEAIQNNLSNVINRLNITKNESVGKRYQSALDLCKNYEFSNASRETALILESLRTYLENHPPRTGWRVIFYIFGNRNQKIRGLLDSTTVLLNAVQDKYKNINDDAQLETTTSALLTKNIGLIHGLNDKARQDSAKDSKQIQALETMIRHVKKLQIGN